MNKIQNFSNKSWTLLISLMAPSTVGVGISSDNGNYDQVQMDFNDASLSKELMKRDLSKSRDAIVDFLFVL